MSYTCPQCGRTSHNPNDERERYCGACHQYEDQMVGPLDVHGEVTFEGVELTPEGLDVLNQMLE